ncbi:ankyrin repeat protein, partial [Necator americanus]
MSEWAESRLKSMSIDATDAKGRTALLLSIACGNDPLAMVLINNGADVVKADGEGKSPLSVALYDRNNLELSGYIVKHGEISAVNHRIDKESLLHIAVKRDSLEISKFLLENKATVDVEDKNGATPLEIAVRQNNVSMVNLLLAHGASVRSSRAGTDSVLHIAVSKGAQMLKVFAEKAKDVDWSTSAVLSYALDEKALDCAKIIVSAGAQVDSKDEHGNTLLIQRILLSDDAGATFLLEQGAEHLAKDSHQRSSFELAACYGLINTLRVICGLGVNINERTNGGFGYTVLKQALSEGHYDCAALLVSLGCDLESTTADGSFIQTMLHHFIDTADENAAVFLVQNGCNGGATRVSRDPGDDKEESVLHRAVSSKMSGLVAALVTAKVNLSWQDAQGRTACHIAVQEKNADALSELLKADDVSFLSIRDKVGQTPFSMAVVTKEHLLAAAIVERQPHVALQTNGNGENLLHTSVKANDLESVLFLLSIQTDATRVTTDGSKRSALHYAANVDNELILRNLILAGCNVSDASADGSTALHIAVRANRHVHAEILLENGADPNIVDERRESVIYDPSPVTGVFFIPALLAAVRCGSVDCVKVLVANPNLDSLATNKNGQSALHLCSTLTSEKMPPRSTPAEICDLLLRREAGRLSDKEFGNYVDLR